MKKLTKVIATIGPSSDSEAVIERLILHGVDIFRFNFKHSSIEWHSQRIDRVNKVAKRLNRTIGTLIDLQGPEIRINMPYETITLQKNQELIFGETVFSQNTKYGLSISHPQIIEHLKSGQKIVADDGAFHFIFEKSNSGKTILISKSDGVLKNHKTLNIPGADFPFPVLVERDFEGLKLAQRSQIDFVALSFVRDPEDISVLRREMKKTQVRARVIAKIETQKALDNLLGIIDVSDGIMVARGDMGVELPIEEVPYHQKLIIKESIKKGKPVITATQMLESMTNHPFPTRAEVSDVANATYDLTDAVMLSGESAVGSFPVEAVDMMRRTVAFNEQKNKVDSRLRFQFELKDIESNICDAAYGLYLRMKELHKKIGGIVIFTKTGRTARFISRYRPLVPIYAFTPSEKVQNYLSLHFGVYTFLHHPNSHKEVTRKEVHSALHTLLKSKLIEKGEVFIVLHGDYWGIEGSSSTIKIIEI